MIYITHMSYLLLGYYSKSGIEMRNEMIKLVSKIDNLDFFNLDVCLVDKSFSTWRK